MDSLSESELFNASVLPLLEERLHQQVNENSYDPQTNRAILRLYQLYPDRAKEESVIYILAKALTALPESDFLLAQYLVPAHLEETPSIKLLTEMHAHLQSGKFAEFWKATHDEVIEKQLKRIKGFEEGIRRFIITAVSITFTEININQLREYVHQAEISNLANQYGLTIDGDNVIMPKSSENQSRPKKYKQNMTIDDISGLMQVLLK
eukprot:gb/GECG01016714.1/.p1 GENE.gb/GECG01016714.1/~~gb/GECG01016714.1/.p1  ORF type:complete len:208 (+),score=19.68 gb/GECG01016714.1/:1-624(+)